MRSPLHVVMMGWSPAIAQQFGSRIHVTGTQDKHNPQARHLIPDFTYLQTLPTPPSPWATFLSHHSATMWLWVPSVVQAIWSLASEAGREKGHGPCSGELCLLALPATSQLLLYRCGFPACLASTAQKWHLTCHLRVTHHHTLFTIPT